MPKRPSNLIALLVLVIFLASCSLPSHIPDPRKIRLPIPAALKPAPTATKTLEPGAPDVTQIPVTRMPTDTDVPPATTQAVQDTPSPEATPTETLVAIEQVPASASQPTSAGDFMVYDESLTPGWGNWSWDTTTNLANTDPVYSGRVSLSAEINKPWAAVYLHADEPITTTGYTAVRFLIHGGKTGKQNIAFKVIDGSNGNWETLAPITPQADTWLQVTVPLERMGSPEDVGALVWQDNSGNPEPAFILDRVSLVARTGPPPPTPGPSVGPVLTIDAQANRKPISPDIYGMNFANEALAAELHLPVQRSGGNSTSLYNWQIDVHNTGSDWFYENIPEENYNPGILPDGSAVDRTVEQDRKTGSQSIITIPLIGWTPKRRLNGHPYDCSFKVSKYGKQESTDPYDPDCGNGKDPNGNNLTGNDPNDAFMPVTTDFIQQWIQHLTGKYGTAAEGGVKFYSLDNEPMLWPFTHRDVHPKLTTYDEIRDKTYLYAAILKQVDPGALTLGPVVWGWCAYFYSAADECKQGPDYASHGSTDFIPWYLQQMSAYEQKHGVRLLDYLDVHIYPQGQGVYSGNPGGRATQELRLRSTRSLWDSTYVDESWIEKPVSLIPRMREWVDKNYPGTKLAITEYNWGAQGNINGALAQADILGIFGREGLDLAALWGPPDLKDPGAYAFRMYLNYDGKGASFGDTSVAASSADQDQLAVYAAQRSSDGVLTLMIINKTRLSLTSQLALQNVGPAAAAQVYRYSAENTSKIVHLPDLALQPDGVTDTFPPNSITLLVIPQGP